jgi:flagellin
MSSSITLTAGVRQNLLSLQNTADLISLTQNRLATGKKVNSALDNPTSFFTSQSLNNRASDLNALLDSIGQAQKTLDAANTGLSSLTKLLQSAKSIAQQARQSSGPTAVTYGAISVNDTTQSETLGTTGNGSAIAVANTTTYSFDVNFNGAGAQTVTYTSDGSATYAEILAGLQASFATAATASGLTAGTDVALVANTAGDGIKINALKADVDTVITANSGAGLTNGTYNSTSLLDRIVAAGGTSGSSTLNVAVNGGSNQTITFGTGVGQVSTIAELNTALGGLTGVTATASGTSLSFSVASSATQNSLTLTGSTGVTTALGVTNGTSNGVASVSTPDATRTSLQSDYNNVLAQIDALAADSSYNGINLLNGDDLKVVFNEKGTSTLTIAGVTYDSAGLGVLPVTGNAFQSNANIDASIATLDTALTTLRNQASKFGSNLTTVQTRQDFTKNLITTLQTGADSLVLADTNEEGANALALQTRQSLSTTALSLANQASQSVLRLFG